MERRVRHKETAGVLVIQQANIMNLVIPSWSASAGMASVLFPAHQ
jgi:hypothetical protein